MGLDVEPAFRELTEAQPTDIPVPNGFRLLTKGKESYSLDLGPGGFRQAHLEYEGLLDRDVVLGFYRRAMVQAPYGWRPDETPGDRDGSLRFVKDNATCRIRITTVRTPEERTRVIIDLKTKRS